MNKLITIALSPNTEPEDVRQAVSVLFNPFSWMKGNLNQQVISWFTKRYDGYFALSYNSGRSAMYELLKAFGIGKGDEVIVQSFSCVAVANSVLWTIARPIFVDIDDSYNIDPEELEKHITKRTKAIVVQHTFGIPAQMERIAKIAQKHHVFLIEDCAHSLGATYEGKLLGTLSDAAFFSFGRDKVVSSVFGGVAIIRNNHKEAVARLKQSYEELSYPSYFWVFQQLFHPIAFSLILQTYTSSLGKLLLMVLQKLRLLSFPVYGCENFGGRPAYFPTRYPDALASLILLQLTKLERYNKIRKSTASYYDKEFRGTEAVTLPPLRSGSIYLRYPIHVKNPVILKKKMQKQGILIGNWYHHVVDPARVNLNVIGYSKYSCPKAEQMSGGIINLPTRITHSQAQQVVRAVFASF